MPVTARCPSCGLSGRVNDEFIGRKVRCKNCGQPFPVAATASSPSTPLPVNATPARPSDAAGEAPATKPCPFCAEPIRVEAKKCRHCGTMLDRPQELVAAAPANRRAPPPRSPTPATRPDAGRPDASPPAGGASLPFKWAASSSA